MSNSLIATKIFWFLDHQDQMACRLVSPTWKAHMDQPSFWIKKCDHDAWLDLLRRVKVAEDGTYLQQELVECLMKWYGKIRSTEIDFDGCAPIHVAASCGVSSILQFIISYSPNTLNVPKVNGWTPIHLAAYFGHTEIVKFLATRMENPNQPRSSDGLTPIYAAAQQGHTEIVKFLASVVEDPNPPTQSGHTPIHVAARNGHTEIVKFLVSFVENPNTPDQNGRTPLDFARHENHTEIVEFLTQHEKIRRN